MKHDEKKPRPSLVYPSLIRAISRVRQHGIEKYGSPTDWRTTTPCYQRHFDAAMRHLLAIVDGELIDQDSGESHTALAATNLMFLIELEENEGPNARYLLDQLRR